MDTYRGTVTDNTGRPVANATVTVYLAGTSTTANLYEETGTTGIANPLTTDANGYYAFAAADNTYDILYSGSGVASATHRRIKLWDFATASAAPFSQVSLSMPVEYSISGSPAGPSGTLTVSWANQTANLVFAGPSGGGATAPTFRALVNADLPASGAAAATYGSATAVAQIVVNTKGVITSASDVTVTPAWGSITSTPTTISGYGITDGLKYLWRSTADNQALNSTSETSMLGTTGEGSLTIAGNSISAGDCIRVKIYGYLIHNTSATMRLKLKYGAYDVVDVTSGSISGVSANSAFTLEALILFRTIGATGSCVATVNQLVNGAQFATKNNLTNFLNTSATTVDTTIDNAIDLTVQYSAAAADTGITSMIATVERLG